MVVVSELVDNAVNENTVAVFSKSWCPYCKRAKQLLKSTPGLDEKDIKIYEIDEMAEESAIQDYLQQKTGQRTVPNIFIKQQHIGGSDDLTAFDKSGKLAKLIAA